MMFKKLIVAALYIGCLASADATEMRLMNFNVNHCEGVDFRVDVGRVAEVVRREAPDFVCLQELDWCSARVGRIDEPAEMARLTGMGITFAKASVVSPESGGWHGVALLSREEPHSKLELPLPGNPARVLLLCEFGDCIVGTTQLSMNSETDRLVSIAQIRDTVLMFASRKPVFLACDWGADFSPESASGVAAFAKVVAEGIVVDNAHADAADKVQVKRIADCPFSKHVPVLVSFDLAEPMASAVAVVPKPASVHLKGAMLRLPRGNVDESIFRRADRSESVPKEGYRLVIDADGVSVAYSTDAGKFYALGTLRQLSSFSYGRLALPVGEIEDAPRFSWRGVHFDDSRHFFGKAVAKRTIRLMSQHKLNVFHWHLTDSQGWRVPMQQYPRLMEVATKRPYSKNQKELADQYEDGTYGPFCYTAEELREVAGVAKANHVRIVPEIDFPAHSQALLLAYPEFGCPFDEGDCPKDYDDSVSCLGNEKAIAFVKDAFDELVRLLPDSEMIHVGGDEVPLGNWNACPKCRAKMRALGLKSSEELLKWFMGEVAAHIRSRGRQPVLWDSDGTMGAPAESIRIRWCEQARWIAPLTTPCVMCPHTELYFDYDQKLADDPMSYPWFSCSLPLARVYAYDPLAGIPEDCRRNVLGGQCCNWSEYTCNETQLEWKMWPRTCAVAEVFWSRAEDRDYSDFQKRLEIHRRRLVRQGVNCAPEGICR